VFKPIAADMLGSTGLLPASGDPTRRWVRCPSRLWSSVIVFLATLEMLVKKEKKFSFAKRAIGGLSILLFVVALVVVAFAGIGVSTGLLLAASVSGVVVPCVISADSPVEIVTDVLELIAESLATLFEGVLDFLASLF
jgi:hypothetical protein